MNADADDQKRSALRDAFDECNAFDELDASDTPNPFDELAASKKWKLPHKRRLSINRRQFQYTLWSMAAFLILLGGLCYYSSFHAPPEKPEGADQLRGLCLWSLSFAFLVITIERAATALIPGSLPTTNPTSNDVS